MNSVRACGIFLSVAVAALGVVSCGSDGHGENRARASYGGRAWRDARLGDKANEVILGFTGPDPSAGAECVESYKPEVVRRDDGTREVLIQVPNPMARASCPTRRIEVSVELATLTEGDVIEAGFSNYRYRLTDGRFEVVPESTPCGRADCSTSSPTPAPCSTASYQEAIEREIDGNIRIVGDPHCDGSFLVIGIDTGSGGCAPAEGAASPCANAKSAYFVARDRKWSVVTYANALTCADVATMTAIRFPASLCN
ncbi:MAG: hypothetical protein QOI44_2291 [Actinomycetota bacterium]|jgi:hypothetical protein|nr:hypothetical protein [Actinomycetota bacterium]